MTTEKKKKKITLIITYPYCIRVPLLREKQLFQSRNIFSSNIRKTIKKSKVFAQRRGDYVNILSFLQKQPN